MYDSEDSDDVTAIGSLAAGLDHLIVQHVARTLPPIVPCAAPATGFVVDMGTAAARRDTTAPWRCRKWGRGRGRGSGKGADGEADCGTGRGRGRGRGRGTQAVDKEVESNTSSESDTQESEETSDEDETDSDSED